MAVTLWLSVMLPNVPCKPFGWVTLLVVELPGFGRHLSLLGRAVHPRHQIGPSPPRSSNHAGSAEKFLDGGQIDPHRADRAGDRGAGCLGLGVG